MATDKVENIEGEHHEEQQKTENDSCGQKHRNCPCLFGHLCWAMAILDFMTFYPFPSYFFTENKKGTSLPFTLWQRGNVENKGGGSRQGANRRARWRWSQTKRKMTAESCTAMVGPTFGAPQKMIKLARNDQNENTNPNRQGGIPLCRLEDVSLILVSLAILVSFCCCTVKP